MGTEVSTPYVHAAAHLTEDDQIVAGDGDVGGTEELIAEAPIEEVATEAQTKEHAEGPLGPGDFGPTDWVGAHSRLVPKGRISFWDREAKDMIRTVEHKEAPIRATQKRISGDRNSASGAKNSETNFLQPKPMHQPMHKLMHQSMHKLMLQPMHQLMHQLVHQQLKHQHLRQRLEVELESQSPAPAQAREVVLPHMSQHTRQHLGLTRQEQHRNNNSSNNNTSRGNRNSSIMINRRTCN